MGTAILASVRPLLLLALALAACSTERKVDPVLKEVLGPPRLTVRRHEVRLKQSCEETGFNVYKCWLRKRTRSGCVYLDVGAPYTDPEGENPCGNPRPQRLVLARAPYDSIGFETDVPGHRFAWRTGGAWNVGYFWNDQFIRASQLRPHPHPHLPSHEEPYPQVPELDFDLEETDVPDGPLAPKAGPPLDWATIPPFDEAVESLYFEAGAAQPELLQYMREHGGAEAITRMVAGATATPDASGWQQAFDSLDPAHQERVTKALIERAEADFTDSAMDWLDMRPDVLPKGFEDKLLVQARAALADGDLERTSAWVQRGLTHHHPEVGRVACELLEQYQLAAAWGANGGYGMPEGVVTDSSTWLAIASAHTKCPAVTRVLGENPCNSELRCAAVFDGGVESVPDLSGVDGPLCGEEQARRALKTIEPALDPGDEPFDDVEPAAKMAALLAQGPLPKSFAFAEARRHYRVDRPKPLEEENYDTTSPCSASDTQVGDFLCQLRPEQTRVTVNACRVEVDDAHRVVHLTPLHPPEPEDGGADAGAEDAGAR